MADDKRTHEEFQVVDRRRFTTEGEPRPGGEAAPAEPAREFQSAAAPPPRQPEAAPPPPSPPGAEQAARKYDEAGRGLQPLTFDQLVLTYARTAMFQLGLIAPAGQKPQPDLAGARETIDILALLAEKTRGNLTPEEHRLLDNSLYELRLAWMEMSKRQAKPK